MFGYGKKAQQPKKTYASETTLLYYKVADVAKSGNPGTEHHDPSRS